MSVRTGDYVGFREIDKAVDALEREIPINAPTARRAMEHLRRVIQDWKDDNTDDGK